MSMDPETLFIAGKTSLKAGKILRECAKNFLEELKPYKPSVKSMAINYQNKDCEYKVLLIIPDGLKRKINHVTLPRNFELYELFDGESFDKVTLPWQKKDGRYQIRASKFPKSEKYFALLKGKLDITLLDAIVSLNVASEPKKRRSIDKYWIQSMIRDVSILEQIWNELNIEDINCSVKVGVDKCFSTNIPKEFREHIESSQAVLSALGSKVRNRNRISYTQKRYKQLSKSTRGGIAPVLKLITELTNPSTFEQYLDVDKPYNLGSITPAKLYRSLIPQSMSVNVHTDLSYKVPAANGDLIFERENYNQKIKNSIRKLKK